MNLYEIWARVPFLVGHLTQKYKTLGRYCFAFCAPSCNCSLPEPPETKKTNRILVLRLPVFFLSFQHLLARRSSLRTPLSPALFPPFHSRNSHHPTTTHCLHEQQSCPLYVPAIPRPDVSFNLHSINVFRPRSRTHLNPNSTRSDNGCPSAPNSCYHISYPTSLHLSYSPQPVRQSLLFAISFSL